MRRSRARSGSELRKMALGEYPFRCEECGYRSSIKVWHLQAFKYAACPRCMSFRVILAPTGAHHLGLFRMLLLQAGAQLYRCCACNRRFVSFKHPLKSEEAPERLPSSRAASA